METKIKRNYSNFSATEAPFCIKRHQRGSTPKEPAGRQKKKKKSLKNGNQNPLRFMSHLNFSILIFMSFNGINIANLNQN